MDPIVNEKVLPYKLHSDHTTIYVELTRQPLAPTLWNKGVDGPYLGYMYEWSWR
jgi:hypothetical protein